MLPTALPSLAPGIPLRELNFPFEQRTISMLVVDDPLALTPDDPKNTDYEIHWGEVWPAAVVLAEALLDGDVWLPKSSKPILELGCGAGLVSIAAALAGGPQARIIASDHEPHALRLTAENARRNGVAGQVSTQNVDWLDAYTERHHLILASDCLYHPEADRHLGRFLRAALDPQPTAQARAVLVDPKRWNARHFPSAIQRHGFRVRQFQRPVPFLSAQTKGPQDWFPRSGPPTDAVMNEWDPLEAQFYELTPLDEKSKNS